MANFDERSIDLHRQNKGKLEIKSKIKMENRDDLSIAYTPGVAAVSRAITDNPDLAKELTIKGNAVAVVTDGSAVLGLGNIGPQAALPVMEGKAILFREFAGVDAYPIILDTQDTDEIIATIKAISPGFAGINLEDISAPRCFEVERRLQDELDIPVFHDDQHGTAIVVLAGLLNALKVVDKDLSEISIVINGAGAAGVAITKLLSFAGIKSLVTLDSKGVISTTRDDLHPSKSELLTLPGYQQSEGTLAQAIKGKDVFIGISKGDLVDADMVQSMNPDPIIFAMANPEPEINPDIAQEAGAAVVATGRSDYPNQVNNVLVFPGIFRGLLDNNINQVTDNMRLQVAKALAGLVPNPTADRILPDPFDKQIVPTIAAAVK